MENIKWVGSPNYSDTRFGATIDRIVCHWIVGTLEAADATFKNPNSQVSAHYGVGDTDVHQYVYEDDTAWHSGVWTMNNRSLGIEHEGGPNLPISDKTYETSAQLIRELCEKYGIPIDRTHIIKHSEVKNTACPGTLDLDRLIAMAKGDGDSCEEEIKNLEKELDEMRESRNKWKRMFAELEEKYAKEIKAKNAQIESLQKQVSTLSQNQISDRKEIESLRGQLKEAEEAYRALEEASAAEMAEKEEKIATLTKTNQALSDSIVLKNDEILELKKENEELKKALEDPIKNTGLLKIIWIKLRG